MQLDRSAKIGPIHFTRPASWQLGSQMHSWVFWRFSHGGGMRQLCSFHEGNSPASPSFWYWERPRQYDWGFQSHHHILTMILALRYHLKRICLDLQGSISTINNQHTNSCPPGIRPIHARYQMYQVTTNSLGFATRKVVSLKRSILMCTQNWKSSWHQNPAFCPQSDASRRGTRTYPGPNLGIEHRVEQGQLEFTF